MHSKMLSRAGIATVLCGLAAVVSAHGAEQTLAVVDMERVIRAYPETASAEAILQKQKNSYQAEQQELLDKGDELKEEFEATRPRTGP